MASSEPPDRPYDGHPGGSRGRFSELDGDFVVVEVEFHAQHDDFAILVTQRGERRLVEVVRFGADGGVERVRAGRDRVLGKLVTLRMPEVPPELVDDPVVHRLAQIGQEAPLPCESRCR